MNFNFIDNLNSLVSIIIPTYNRAHLIWETLDSVIAQTYQNWECIVVDDGSTDSTAELLEFYCKKDSRIQFYDRPKEHLKGANACRNFGFELSKGEFVNWFDDDDVMLPDFITQKINQFISQVEVVICSGMYVDANLIFKGKISITDNGNLFKNYMLWITQIVTNSVMFRKIFLFDKKLFKDCLTRGQEEELFSRLFYEIKPYQVGIIKQPLFLYRQHSGTITSENNTYNKINKESEAYVYYQNLKRCLFIKEFEISNLLFRRLINLFFLGLKYSHWDNSQYIIKSLSLVVFKYNKKQSAELMLFGYTLLLLKRSSYRIEKRWKQMKIINTFS